MSLQAETLLTFTALFAIHKDFRRKLALCVNAGNTGCAAALAVTALGGTCLLLDEDAGSLQAAGRAGATDFTVTDLSEALRILKNELRRGTPVSVGLSGGLQAVVDAMVRRGVQPDLVFGIDAEEALLQPFVALGAASLRLPAALPVELVGARLSSNKAENAAERRRLDQLLAAQNFECSGAESDMLQAVHSRWLAVASRLFRADRYRVYWQMEKGK